MIKKIFYWLVFSLITYLVISYIPFILPRSFGGHRLKIIFSFFLHFPLIVFFLKGETFKVKIIKTGIYTFSIVLLTSISILTNLKETSWYMVSHLSTLSSFLAVFLGFMYSILNFKGKVTVVLSFFAFILWLSYSFFDIWMQRVNFETYTGRLQEPIPLIDFQVYALNNDKVFDFASSKEKIWVIDCWTSTCGACFELFPKFEKLANEYKEYDNIEFIALNSIYKGEKPEQNYQLIEERNLKFNVGFIDFETAKINGIKVYPTYLIVKNNQIVYLGTNNFLKKNIRFFLEK